MPPVIEVRDLSKRYYLGRRAANTFRESFDEWIGSMLRPQKKPAREELWALKDVSFDVHVGETVGILGRNGAGKSTLLKILSRITAPTSGNAIMRGRTASLLEVGTGFHPDLSGRENVYLNGAILGMKRHEIREKFDEIIAFSEIEKFVDVPVKRYSSGMYVRLAFAVAAHLKSEILLVDETLAVGDAAFQAKCLDKIGNLSGQQGRTVLFVSHSVQALSVLTARTIVLDKACIAFEGPTMQALDFYRAVGGAKFQEQDYDAPGKSAGILKVKVQTSRPNRVHNFGKELVFDFDASFDQRHKTVGLSVQIRDEQKKPVVHIWIDDLRRFAGAPGRINLRCVIPAPRLYMGRYSLSVFLADRSTMETIDSIHGVCPFQIVMDGIPREFPWAPQACVYLEDAQWEIRP